MRHIVATLFLLLLSACVVTSERYYLPVDPSLVTEGKVCGFVPWGSAHIPLVEGLAASISLAPVKGQLSASIQLSIPTGTTVRFTKSEIRFDDLSTGKEYFASLKQWQVGVYGRGGRPGYHDYFGSDAFLEGRGRNAELAGTDSAYLKADLFISSAAVQAPDFAEVMMTLPPIEINGVAVQSKAVPLRLVQKTGVMTCIQ